MPEPPVRMDEEKKIRMVLGFVVAIPVALFVLYLLLRQIYIDTHCTTILGTRICR